jgi:hypothetical protein
LGGRKKGLPTSSRARTSRSASRSAAVEATSSTLGISGSSPFCRSAHCAMILILRSASQPELSVLRVVQAAMVPCTSPLSNARLIFEVL